MNKTIEEIRNDLDSNKYTKDELFQSIIYFYK